MRIKYLLLFVLLTATMMRCAEQKKLAYNIPAEMHGKNKEELLNNIDKGSRLFKKNCGDCHGIFTKGKTEVPNFSDKQIESYQMMYKLKDPKNHAFAKKLMPEEMDQIAVFLKFVRTDSSTTH